MAKISKINLDGTTYDIADSRVDNLQSSEQNVFIIKTSMLTVTTDATKGTSPYSTTYGYTNIEINKDAGIRWVEGGLYLFVLEQAIGNTTYRNGRIRIGGASDGDVWHPLMEANNSIALCDLRMAKTTTIYWQYKSIHQSIGALHRFTDADTDTTYGYLVDSVPSGALKISSDGYGARYSLAFPRVSMSDAAAGTVERYSSLVKSSATGTTKTYVSGKFYIDRHPQYINSANIAAGAASAAVTYENYNSHDLRYLANISSTYIGTSQKVFLWLRNFDITDFSFEAPTDTKSVISLDKLSTAFPSTTEGAIYLYLLGHNTATYYTCYPNFTQANKIYKFTPSTGTLETVDLMCRCASTPGFSIRIEDGKHILTIGGQDYLLTPYDPEVVEEKYLTVSPQTVALNVSGTAEQVVVLSNTDWSVTQS